MNDEEKLGYEKSYTLSSPDKLDWNERIEQRLYICTCFRGWINSYKLAVNRLEDCVKDNFYGLDFRTPIEKNIKVLDAVKPEQEKLFIGLLEDGIYYHPKCFDDLISRDKKKISDWMEDWYWHKRFEFVRGLLASHRGLLWGKKKLPTGFLGEDNSVAGNEINP